MLKNKIIYLNAIFRGSTKKLSKYIESDPDLKGVDYKLAQAYVSNLQVKCITLFEKEYPSKLKAAKYPPWVIYYKGDLKLLNNQIVSILSDHYPTSYGKFVSIDIVNILSEKTIMLSKGIGVATDVEREVQKTNRPTIFVHAVSIEKVNCNEHDLNLSIVVPELKNIDKTIQNDFIFVPIISHTIVVVEAACESSINKIVDIALDFNVQVYGVPGNVYSIKSLGVNNMIQDGANVFNIKLDI